MSYSSEKTPRGLVILGATGSIGTNAVAVVASRPGEFRVRAITCGTKIAKLREAAMLCRAEATYCAAFPQESTLHSEEELLEIIADDKTDIVLCAIQGIKALRAVMTALEHGKTVALATKEVLVGAGGWVMATAERHHARLLPVDSEHCAIFQCLRGNSRDDLRRILLTCSGGPFHAHPEVDLHAVTPDQAARHPKWTMGAKITLDSATLMNKAFEIIEAAWFYQTPEEKIEVVIHPQAIIHSMVEYSDGAILAQLGPTDMKLPIQYCLDFPNRRALPPQMQPLDFTAMGPLTFAAPDHRRFPALSLAHQVLRQGGLHGAVFNAANDAACGRFLQGSLHFDEIVPAVADALEATPAGDADSYDAIEEAAAIAKQRVEAFRP